MLLKTSNETALCNGMMMVVDAWLLVMEAETKGDVFVWGYFLFCMTVGIA